MNEFLKLFGDRRLCAAEERASPPTLYSAGPTTQLMYEIVGADDTGMEEFNAIAQRVERKSWSAASQMYCDRGWNAVFVGAASEVMSRNLCLIRELMEEILGWVYRRALLEDYDPNRMRVKCLCEQLVKENPIGYSAPELVYEKALKDFLCASFFGMTGETPWDGSERVNGGVLRYHASDREVFRSYLFNRTNIEYVSKRKYNWGRMYKEGGRYCLPLNASVRLNRDFQED